MSPNYLRFAQTLAFVSSAALVVGCGSRIIADNGSPVGTCKSLDPGGTEIGCSAGGTCTMTFGAGASGPVCQPPGYDAGYVPPACGAISCATYCSCTDAGASTCGCTSAVVGPLPPPELAA
jgi:hypothetical protein